MEISILLDYWRGVLKDRKLHLLLGIGGILGAIAGITGSFLPMLLAVVLAKGYGVLVVSLVWYSHRGELQFQQTLHSLPLSALGNPKIWEVAFGVIVGEIGAGIGGALFLYIASLLLGELGFIVGLLLFLYFLIGKEGASYASSSFKEAVLNLLSLFWEFRYWKLSFNPVYSSLFFILVFSWVWLIILVSLLESISPLLGVIGNGVGVVLFSALFPVAGYLADESVKELERF